MDENGKAILQATILEIHDGYYLVEPVEGSTEWNSANRITVSAINRKPSPEPEMFWKLNMTVRLQNRIQHKLLMSIALVLSNNEDIDKNLSRDCGFRLLCPSIICRQRVLSRRRNALAEKDEHF